MGRRARATTRGGGTQAARLPGPFPEARTCPDLSRRIPRRTDGLTPGLCRRRSPPCAWTEGTSERCSAWDGWWIVSSTPALVRSSMVVFPVPASTNETGGLRSIGCLCTGQPSAWGALCDWRSAPCACCRKEPRRVGWSRTSVQHVGHGKGCRMHLEILQMVSETETAREVVAVASAVALAVTPDGRGQ